MCGAAGDIANKNGGILVVLLGQARELRLAARGWKLPVAIGWMRNTCVGGVLATFSGTTMVERRG